MKKTFPRLVAAALLLFILLSFLVWYYSSVKTDNVRRDLKHAIYKDPQASREERVEDLLKRMTLEEKIGQMVMVDKRKIAEGDTSRYKIGAMLSGGGANPEENTPRSWLHMVLDLKKKAKNDLGIPAFYAVDAIHGHGNVVGATIFPHNIGLGAANDPNLVERIGRATAEELKATGVYWNFAPNLDIARDHAWGRMYESFGEDAQTVSELGAAYVRGLQNGTGTSIDVLATAKHYLGGGAGIRVIATEADFKIDQGVIDITERQMRAEDLVPFKSAIDAGVLSIMVSHFSYEGDKMSVNKYWMTDVLKTELGFQGFLISDWESIYDISPNYESNIIESVNAGMDMAMAPNSYAEFIDILKRAVERGDVSEERVDDAVRRILRTKFALGLFDRQESEGSPRDIGSLENRELAREAVRKSVVVLENKDETLPLRKDVPTIYVAGRGAENIGMQSGGWTINWQGGLGETTEGTTILQAIADAVPATTVVEFDESGHFDDLSMKAEIGIVVVGEEPYAEGEGDKKIPELSEGDKEVVRRMREKCDKLIVILLTGRPLLTVEEERYADAVIVAWLPGTEGEGVTDVLFGDYPFTGELPVAWPIR